MQHTAGKVWSADAEAMQGELPALLVPGGSCSNLCRPHNRDEATPAHAEILPEQVLIGLADEWSRLTATDRSEIRTGGSTVLIAKLAERYGWDEPRARAKLRGFMATLDCPDTGADTRDRATLTTVPGTRAATGSGHWRS